MVQMLNYAEKSRDFVPGNFDRSFQGERQPWRNYENNGNEYLIIGAVRRSEYSNIRYKHFIIGNV